MTLGELQGRLEAVLRGTRSASEMYGALKEFAQSGGTAEEAQTELERLGQHYTREDEEDLILSMLDYVGGHCLPEFRLWAEE
jgi:hypothetical protein